MHFDKNSFQLETLTLGGETIRFRSWKNLVYVERPVNETSQQMNIFAPEDYFEGKTINGYDIATAPVFMPNAVGGYMPGPAEVPGALRHDPTRPNSIFCALRHGYVVASPAIRGRTQQDTDGKYTGKAPACIVDYKAAVRFLHCFAKDLPGDENRIITNGTSAGGALSALMGATGNHPDYEPYLKELGAADAGDEVFAASCYCPITDLEHADMAYEWEFFNVNDYHRHQMRMEEGGRPVFTPVDGVMTPLQTEVSSKLAAHFPAYVNSLYLKAPDGSLLSLDENGEGSFQEYFKQIVLSSAQRAIDSGTDVSSKSWLTVQNRKAVAMDFHEYAKDITRMKTAPAFDALTMDSPENSLFGSKTANCRHFTAFSCQNSLADGPCAGESIIKLLNPMHYIEDERAVTAKHWRIRHGECDRDTSLAISAMLTLKLQNNGSEVDYHAPWNVPHSGDYDLDDLFAWIDSLCQRHSCAKITMLGTGNATVTKCYNTCFLLECNGEKLLVDAGGGNGIMIQFEKLGISFSDIHEMFLTHGHTDHILGAIWVVRMVATQMGKGKYQGDFRIYANAKAAGMLTAFCEMTLAKKQRDFLNRRIFIQTVENNESRDIAGMRLTFFDIYSTKEEQFGFRAALPDGTVLVCLGDEPYNEKCREYVDKADYLMSEAFCLYEDRERFNPYEKHHSTALDAGRVAAALDAQNLILYHTEDKTLSTRKKTYASEAGIHFHGRIFVPDDLEEIPLDGRA